MKDLSVDNLISIKDLSKSAIELIFKTADNFKKILVSHTSVHMQIDHEEKQKSKKQINSNLKKIQS